MKKEEAALIKALGQTVASLVIPGAAAPLVGTALDRLLAARTSPPRRLGEMILEKGRQISEALMAAEHAGHVNPGSGYAAVVDLTAILGRVAISPALLVRLEFDSDRLWLHFLQVAEPNLAEASEGRRGRLETALHEVSEAVLEFAPDLPAVRLEFMREVLRRLPLSATRREVAAQ